MGRWQSISPESDWHTRLDMAVPGVEFDTYRWAGISILVLVVLVLLGSVWAVIGVLEFLGAFVLGCSFLTVICSLLFIVLRFGALVCMLLLVYHILDEIQRHRSRNSVLGRSAPLMAEGGLPWDVSAPRNHHEFLYSPAE